MQLASGSNINNLKTEHIDNLLIPTASMKMQKQFVTFIQQSDKSKFELEQALAELTATYKKIISENLG
jgi:type I restriction enzyme S subunit